MKKYREQADEEKQDADVLHDEQIEHARHVRALVEAGLSTRMIKIVLDIETPEPKQYSTMGGRAAAEELARELRVVENRIVCLEKSRDAVIDANLAKLVETHFLVKPHCGFLNICSWFILCRLRCQLWPIL